MYNYKKLMNELKEKLIDHFSNFESLQHFTAEDILKKINEISDEIDYGPQLSDHSEQIKQLEIELFSKI